MISDFRKVKITQMTELKNTISEQYFAIGIELALIDFTSHSFEYR